MGHDHLTTELGFSTSGRRRRLGWRRCLRKGCGRTFRARRYNQQYCREHDCQRELRRWQAAKRQRKCRAQPEGREKHAEAERARRAKARKLAESEPASTVVASQAGTWSRRRRLPEIFCDRPGCYEPPRESSRTPARYCGEVCAAAMRQARDRQRKWLKRKTEVGRFKRGVEYQTAQARRRQSRAAVGGFASQRCSPGLDQPQRAVVVYRPDEHPAVSFSGPREVKNHDPKTSLDPRTRAPPAS